MSEVDTMVLNAPCHDHRVMESMDLSMDKFWVLFRIEGDNYKVSASPGLIVAIYGVRSVRIRRHANS